MSRSSHLPFPDPTLIVIPARDEQAALAEVLAALGRQPGIDVVVVSDHSSDRTVEIAREHGVAVLDIAVQLGAWGATQAGLRYAQRRGYRRVVTMDADGQHCPACVPKLVQDYARGGADVVIGTFPQRLSRGRRLAWHWFRTLTGLKVEDLTSGFRVYGERAIGVLASAEATLLDYQDVGVLLLLRKYGLAIRELPVQMFPRSGGKSRIFASWMLVGRYMVHTSILCISRIGRLRPMLRASGDLPGSGPL